MERRAGLELLARPAAVQQVAAEMLGGQIPPAGWLADVGTPRERLPAVAQIAGPLANKWPLPPAVGGGARPIRIKSAREAPPRAARWRLSAHLLRAATCAAGVSS